jgi:hypothetical protein
MKYEMPSVFDVGAVEEVTFGGNLYPAAMDHFTFYIGFVRPPPD